MKIVLRGGGKKIVLRQTGRRGPAGEGVPTGGTTGEVLTKTSNTDYDTEWAPVPSAPVDSVNGQTGVVVLDASDVGADPAGSAAQALSDANDYTDSAVAGVDTGVMTVVAGNNVTVDSTDPANPVVNADDAPVDSVNGQTGAVVLDKSDVGLSNVDNTSDLAKPISTATQTALNLKLDASRLLQGVGFPNGTVTAPVGTIYVDTAVTNGASSWIKKSGTGNTGWVVLEGRVGRTIPEGDLLNGWDYELTDTAMRLYREGDIVTLVIAAIGLRGTNATANIFYELPLGFRIATTGNYGTLGYIDASGGGPTRVTKDFNHIACPARASVSGILTWKTTNEWPSVLPGTPA